MKTERINIKWSRKVWTVSILCSLALAVGIFELIQALLQPEKLSFFIGLTGIIVIAIAVLYAISFMPLYLLLKPRAFVLKKGLGTIELPYSVIRSIRPFNMKKDYRLLGSGGYWGYTGLFMNRELGRYKAFVGDVSQAFIIITSDGGLYVFSCENYKQTIQKIKERVNSLL
ncbi:MAG: PH domain-containing protein [Bacteroidales bacterium]|jgi:hypothetical protein|nr:PH domain-containing protein [Bacteroidales bacterium]MDD3160943.1 PH domain-containing protein [Bacteroidales bacterium]